MRSDDKDTKRGKSNRSVEVSETRDDRRNVKRKRREKRVLQARTRFCKFPISMHRLAYRCQRFLTIFFCGILREDTRRMENERSSRYEILLIKCRKRGIIFHANNQTCKRRIRRQRERWKTNRLSKTDNSFFAEGARVYYEEDMKVIKAEMEERGLRFRGNYSKLKRKWFPEDEARTSM